MLFLHVVKVVSLGCLHSDRVTCGTNGGKGMLILLIRLALACQVWCALKKKMNLSEAATNASCALWRSLQQYHVVTVTRTVCHIFHSCNTSSSVGLTQRMHCFMSETNYAPPGMLLAHTRHGVTRPEESTCGMMWCGARCHVWLRASLYTKC